MNQVQLAAWCRERGVSVETAREQLRTQVSQALAQSDLCEFGREVLPRFEVPPHIKYIAGLLEKCERRELDRLVISVPVRHGKSVLCSRLFPAWYVGRHPREHVIIATYAESLSVENSRAALHFVQEDKWPFPGVRLSDDSASVQRWNVQEGGGVYAVGVGGGITGRGANCLIIDDPIHDALAQSERDKAWQWFQEIALPRLEPGAIVIVVAARFAPDDLVGRLQDADESDEWMFVSLPALAEEHDPLGRAPGEALWPARVSVEQLNRQRSPQAMGETAFQAQFQQNPVPAGGILFAKEWFENYYDTLPNVRAGGAVPELDPIQIALGRIQKQALAPIRILSIDCAARKGVSSDLTAMASLVTDLVDIYIEWVWTGRLSYPELKAKVIEQYGIFKPSAIYVEEASNGYALLDELRLTTPIPLIGVSVGSQSKLARAEAASPMFQAGRVKLPRMPGKWLPEFLRQFLRFTGNQSAHDDIVDAVCMGVTQLQLTNLRVLEAQSWTEQFIDNGDWFAR